jgi:hypothetical protein
MQVIMQRVAEEQGSELGQNGLKRVEACLFGRPGVDARAVEVSAQVEAALAGLGAVAAEVVECLGGGGSLAQLQGLRERESDHEMQLGEACRELAAFKISRLESMLLCTARKLREGKQLASQRLAHASRVQQEIRHLQKTCLDTLSAVKRIPSLKKAYQNAQKRRQRKQKDRAIAKASVDFPEEDDDRQRLEDDLKDKVDALRKARGDERRCYGQIRELQRGPTPEIVMDIPSAHALHGTKALALVKDHGLDTYGKLTKISQRGANHCVWKAIDPDTKEPCVLKEFKGCDAQKWLRRQAHVMARLRHRNLLSIQAIFEDGGSFYVQSPYCAEGSLAKWINTCRQGQGTLAEIRQIIHGMLLGLHHLHAEGVIHRDLKPDNVVLNQGRAVLIDFELCFDSTLATLRTAAGFTVNIGTRGFMAPEVMGGQPATAASDIHALGSIIHELCDAWKAGSCKRGGAGSVPSELEAVVQRMRHKNPQARPTSMDLLASPLLSLAWGAEQDKAEEARALRHLQESSAKNRMVGHCLLLLLLDVVVALFAAAAA